MKREKMISALLALKECQNRQGEDFLRVYYNILRVHILNVFGLISPTRLNKITGGMEPPGAIARIKGVFSTLESEHYAALAAAIYKVAVEDANSALLTEEPSKEPPLTQRLTQRQNWVKGLAAKLATRLSAYAEG